MDLLQQFLLYNFLPALGVGTLVWLVIEVVIRLFKIEQGTLRLTLLYAPVVKSALILIGVGSILTWPYSFWKTLHDKSVPFNTVIPILLIWLGIVIVIRRWLLKRIRFSILENTEEANLGSPRLEQSMERVLSAYAECRGVMVGNNLISCLNTEDGKPDLYISDGKLNSPLIITQEKRPIIVFPRALIEELTDEELDGALAHEYAHFQLRHRIWCSSENMNYITPISPIARLLSSQLNREEEKTCDDMAIRAIGNPDVYAEMLLKSYQFSRKRNNPLNRGLHALPQLVGLKPTIYERIERLVNPIYLNADQRMQYTLFCLTWLGLFALFGIQ